MWVGGVEVFKNEFRVEWRGVCGRLREVGRCIVVVCFLCLVFCIFRFEILEFEMNVFVARIIVVNDIAE